MLCTPPALPGCLSAWAGALSRSPWPGTPCPRPQVGGGSISLCVCVCRDCSERQLQALIRGYLWPLLKSKGENEQRGAELAGLCRHGPAGNQRCAFNGSGLRMFLAGLHGPAAQQRRDKARACSADGENASFCAHSPRPVSGSAAGDEHVSPVPAPPCPGTARTAIPRGAASPQASPQGRRSARGSARSPGSQKIPSCPRSLKPAARSALSPLLAPRWHRPQSPEELSQLSIPRSCQRPAPPGDTVAPGARCQRVPETSLRGRGSGAVDL